MRFVYFNPFLKLIQKRHQKTVEDRKKAESILQQAEEKMREYSEKLKIARNEAQGEFDRISADAKSKEAEIIAGARIKAKEINQEVAQQVAMIQQDLRSKLEKDIDQMVNTVVERLVAKR